MWFERLRLEFGMELASDEVWMIWEVDHFDRSSMWCGTGKRQSASRKWCFVLAVEFVTMPMTLADFGLAVDPIHESSRFDLARPCTQAHCSAEFFNPAQFAQLVDDAVRSCGIKLAGVCVSQSTNVARELDARCLHSEADAEVRNPFLARITDRLQHAFDSALSESARHQNAVVAAELLFTCALAGFESFGLNPAHV